MAQRMHAREGTRALWHTRSPAPDLLMVRRCACGTETTLWQGRFVRLVFGLVIVLRVCSRLVGWLDRVKRPTDNSFKKLVHVRKRLKQEAEETYVK